MANINWKSRVDDDITIGRKDSSKLFFRLERWKKECSINLDILVATTSDINEISSKQLKYSSPLVDVTFHKKEPYFAEFEGPDKRIHRFQRNEQGGLEFDVVLKAKPKRNYFEFSLANSNNLIFAYQPELTQEQKDRGDFRPDDVVGSYAVYHKTKGRMVEANGEDYRAGKAYHIYRPKVTDDNGDWIWAELNIANGILRVTVDKEWLDKAIYPVTIDPNFGYETIGGTSTTCNDYVMGSPYTPAGAGTATSITAYTNFSASGMKIKYNLYDADGTNAKTGTNEIEPGATSWDEATFAVGQAILAQVYIIVAWGDASSGSSNLYYDTSPAINDVIYDSETYGATWPDPANTSSTDAWTSIYCTYTASTTYTLTCDAGSYAITGTALTPLHGKVLGCAAGSYAITGTALSPLHGKKIDAVAGSYAITGTATSPLHNKVLSAASGSYTLTGTALTPLHNKVLTAEAGSYTITGTAVTLTYGAGGVVVSGGEIHMFLDLGLN